MGLKDVRALGLAAGDFNVVWADELDRYLSSYDKVVEVDEAYVSRVKSLYDENVYSYKYSGEKSIEEYALLRSYLRFDIGVVDKSSKECKVYKLGNIELYNIVSVGIIIVVYGGVVVGYTEVYSNNQLYYDLHNNSLNYKTKGYTVWWLYDDYTCELLNSIE